MVFTTEGFFEVAIEGWPEWELNPRHNYIYIYTHTHTRIYIMCPHETMCPPVYHHNDSVAIHALGHMLYGYILLVPIN